MNPAFDDIRPYTDPEIRPTLDRLLADRELINTIGQYRFPKLYSKLSFILAPLTRFYLARQYAHINSVEPLQDQIKVFIDRVIANSITKLSSSGLEQLKNGENYLFVSNHRDIVMDPALVNYALHDANVPTCHIAIGDNLLSKPFVSDLMRINKSFIVKRAAKGPRELYKNLKILSQYISHTVGTEHTNIWIAQREGRAKDGNDLTEPAIIKMFAMAKPKQESLSEYIHKLKIVPVAISYEWDPCDQAKARELAIKEKEGEYIKQANEDNQSIALGISGFKGKVHVGFGSPLSAHYENADAVANAINEQVDQLYKIQAPNRVAAALLEPKQFKIADKDLTAKKLLEERLLNASVREREILIKMYAYPLLKQKA